MRLGINGWRIHGNRTGVGRYLLNIVRCWTPDFTRDTFGQMRFYSHLPLDRREIPLPSHIRHEKLSPDMRMLFWENLRLGPSVDDEVLWCPSFSRPYYTRAKTVVTVYEATLALYPQYFPRNHFFARPSIYIPIYRWSAQNATLVLTTTQAAKQDIMKAFGVPEDRIRLAPLAPAPEFVPIRDQAALRGIREKYWGADVPFFLFVGKLTPRRNVPMLMEAFARLKQAHRLPHRLLVAGMNTTGIDLAAHAKALGITSDFLHTGYVPNEDLLLLYNASDCFVLPYAYEALSLTTMEAQAVGVPVITTDVPGLRETTGGHALLLPEAAVEPLVEAMLRIAQDRELHRELSEIGPEYMKQYSWDRTARATLATLWEAANL
jgi:glycosyltransferase involved in cell wall biosynthesis